MVSINKYNDHGNNFAMELYGLSTDEKPIGSVSNTKLANGSTFFCMDTKAVFVYDEENQRWLEV